MLALAALATMALTHPLRADAFVGCSFSGKTLDVSLTGKEDSAKIQRFGDQIALVTGGEDGPEILVACSGGTPTVTNTDTINVHQSGGSQYSGGVTIDLSQGPLAPGATAEPDGSSEIEMALTGPGGKNSGFVITGSAGADTMTAGTTAAGPEGVNLNAAAEGSSADADIIFSGEQIVGISGEDGNDTLSGAGGPGFTAPVRSAFFEAVGGDGNDTLAGGPRGSLLFGGAGRDRLIGAEGGDLISGGHGKDLLLGAAGRDYLYSVKGGVDKVRCGPGGDLAQFDRYDRQRGCELRNPSRRRRRHLKFPIPVLYVLLVGSYGE
jgi:Ca2+-binding RTX toxin-like protein